MPPPSAADRPPMPDLPPTIRAVPAEGTSSGPHPLRSLSSSRNRRPSRHGLRSAVEPAAPPLPHEQERRVLQEQEHARAQTGPLQYGSPANSAAVDLAQSSSASRKHSHGLSWSSHTRDSLVDNLLLSLDQIAGPPVAKPPPSTPAMAQYGITQLRGQQPASHARPDTLESPGRTSLSQGPGHHRQQSGHNSITSGRGGSIDRVSSDMARRHGSKSIDISHDYQTDSPTRLRPRASSRERHRAPAADLYHESILSRGRPLPSTNAVANAAPEPTVPSGPASSRAAPKSITSTGQRARSVGRKQSAHSQQDQPRSPRLPPDLPDDVRSQAGDFVRASTVRTLQSSGSVSGFTSTTPSSINRSSAPPPPQDEKRGFFKRVFGSSSSKSNLVLSDNASSNGSPSVTRQGSAVDTSHVKREPSPAPPPGRELSKKSSSFFRRRKKSVVDAADIPSIPPPFPIAAPENASTPARSSLYKAMDPYLGETVTTPTRPQARPAAYEPRSVKKRGDASPSSEDTDDPALFHSGYKPSPEAGLNNIMAAPDNWRPGGALSNDYGTDDLPLRGHLHQGETSGRTNSIDQQRPYHDNPASIPLSASSATLPLRDRRSLDQQSSASKAAGSADNSSNTGSRAQMSGLHLQTCGPHHAFQPSPIDNAEDVFVTPSERTTFPSPVREQNAGVVSSRITTLDDLGIGYDQASAPSIAQNGSQARTQDAQDVSSDRTGSVDVPRNMSVATAGTTMTSMSQLIEGPTYEDREHALSIYNGDEEFVPRASAATFLGERKASNVNTLIAFMELFTFTNQTILGGMRMLCNKLVLKAESQQVDRILDAFAQRWCECNPDHGFKIKDVVHTICYSILLLNTDLHMADIESKMTRTQFVKNTLPTIKRVLADASPAALEHSDRTTPSSVRPGMQWQNSTNSLGGGAAANPRPSDVEGSEGRRPSVDSRRPNLSKRMSWSLGMANKAEIEMNLVPNSGSNALVGERFDGKAAEWHYELESILKSFFSAIKAEALPLVRADGRLQRRGSIKSMAPSEMSYRSKKTDFHSMRWGKTRNRGRFYGSSTHASSRTSFDDGSSAFSPAGSFAWSKLSLGKTLTTVSNDSLGGHYGADQGFPQTIGFANALSQTIAREDGIEDDSMSINPQKFLLEDDSLELAGAPWAKEGLVKHKHHLETTDKKAKERNWTETFAVIEKGYLRLFSFNSKGGKTGSLGVRKSMQKGKAPSITPNVVGGGNWMQNAESMGNFLLRQTIASTLPPPGYSKARPHVWALSLPNGAVHLFQVGTAEIAREFMNTANYWSARLSKEPLAGGVDNIEYGWGDSILTQAQIHPALIASAASNTGSSPPTTSAAGGHSSPDSGLYQQQQQPFQRERSSTNASSKPPSRHGAHHSQSNSFSIAGAPPTTARASFSASMRGSIDHGLSAVRSARLPGDRAHIEDWKPPAQSMMASQLMAVDQLQALKDYVDNVETELSRHNELRSSLPSAYTPRHPNLARAVTNWERKSAYLLREIVKFRTYIDALNLAAEEKTRIDAERVEREAEKEERERKKKEKSLAATTAASAAAAAEGQTGLLLGSQQATPTVGSSGDGTPTASTPAVGITA